MYNCARKAKSEGRKDTDPERRVSAIVFTELVLYIEETSLDEETAPVFKFADLIQLYQSRMEQLEVSTDTRLHSTRLKHRLLAQFPDMQTHNKGRDVLIVFEEDVGAVLATACWLECDSDAVHLACAEQIVQQKCLEKPSPLMDSRKMPRGICSFTSARPCEHDSRGSQYQRPDGRHNSCSTCSCPNIEVQQHQAQADTWHINSQCQAQHCTGDTSSNIHRDDVECSYMQEGTNRQVVTPRY